MTVLRFIAKLLVGLVLGSIAALFLSPALAALSPDPELGVIGFFAVLALVIVLCLFAPTLRRCFGRGFLAAGVAAILLPISTMILSGRAATEIVSETSLAGGSDVEMAGTAIGVAIGSGLVTGVSFFVGIIAGLVFLVIGLVLALGGRREVIIVEDRRQA